MVSSGERLPFYVGRFHLSDWDSVWLGFNLVAQLVASFEFSIEHNVYRLALRGKFHAHSAGNLECKDIAHQGLVAVVVYQRPFLGFGRSVKHVLFLVKFYTPRFFGVCAR